MEDFKDFKNRKPDLISELDWKRYAIFIPLLRKEGEWHFLFEVRSFRLKNQPGEVSFPGGALDKGESAEEAALRECREELLIQDKQMQIWGPGDILITPGGKRLDSFVGQILDYKNTYSKNEVARVFSVPIRYFRSHSPLVTDNPVNIQLAENFPVNWIPQKKNYPWQMGNYRILFYPHQQALIWGMTARILHSTLDLLERYQLLEAMDKIVQKPDDK